KTRMENQGKQSKPPPKMTVETLQQIVGGELQHLKKDLNKINAAYDQLDIVVQNQAAQLQLMENTINAQGKVLEDLLLVLDFTDEEEVEAKPITSEEIEKSLKELEAPITKSEVLEVKEEIKKILKKDEPIPNPNKAASE
ncbi:MAG: hypothetical protein KAR20_10415, partial [Candidatus Heimdallarchaeota archaeon]|nr:hypothetical protein [Candidatus Heimdallarchaeota archaeon]